MFNKYTAAYTVGRYYLLILDNHKSYTTADVDYFYKKHQIISFYILSYLLYQLQSLDVGYFTLLKQIYSQQI